MASDCRLLLEDGSALLLEDGDNLLLENCVPSGGGGSGCDLLLEDGGLLLQENGFALLLEDCGVTPSAEVLSGGFVRQRPRRIVVNLEPDDDVAVATSVLALMRTRRWRFGG